PPAGQDASGRRSRQLSAFGRQQARSAPPCAVCPTGGLPESQRRGLSPDQTAPAARAPVSHSRPTRRRGPLQTREYRTLPPSPFPGLLPYFPASLPGSRWERARAPPPAASPAPAASSPPAVRTTASAPPAPEAPAC